MSLKSYWKDKVQPQAKKIVKHIEEQWIPEVKKFANNVESAIEDYNSLNDFDQANPKYVHTLKCIYEEFKNAAKDEGATEAQRDEKYYYGSIEKCYELHQEDPPTPPANGEL